MESVVFGYLLTEKGKGTRTLGRVKGEDKGRKGSRFRKESQRLPGTKVRLERALKVRI